MDATVREEEAEDVFKNFKKNNSRRQEGCSGEFLSALFYELPLNTRVRLERIYERRLPSGSNLERKTKK